MMKGSHGQTNQLHDIVIIFSLTDFCSSAADQLLGYGLQEIHWTESEWVYFNLPSGGSLVQMITTLSAPPDAKLINLKGEINTSCVHTCRLHAEVEITSGHQLISVYIAQMISHNSVCLDIVSRHTLTLCTVVPQIACGGAEIVVYIRTTTC